MSSRSLALLRTALEEPGKVPAERIGDPTMERLFKSWSALERTGLKMQIEAGVLPRAMNDVFLAEPFSSDAARSHPLLGRYVASLSDDQISSIRDAMVRKRACV